MESVVEVIKVIFENLPAIFAALGATVAAASAWVLITPSPRDDEVIGKVRAIVERLSAFFPSEGVKSREIADE